MKVLLLDHNVNPQDRGAHELRNALHRASAVRGLSAEIHVRRPEGGDLPVESGWDAVVLSGSLHTCTESIPRDWLREEFGWLNRTHLNRTPILGVCFGHQILARALQGGAHIGRKASVPEHGWTALKRLPRPSLLLDGLKEDFYSFSSHYEEIVAAPPGTEVTSRSSACEIQSYESTALRIFGTQFHAERDRSGEEKTRLFLPPNERGRFLEFPKEPSFDPVQVGNQIFGNFLSFAASLGQKRNTK